MPDLSTDIHTKMLRDSKRRYSMPARLVKAIYRSAQPWVYGTQWGVIEDVPPLKHTLENWVEPYVNARHSAVEIGPGGGRWTSRLLGFGRLYLVEYYDEVFAEIKRNLGVRKNVTFIKNSGTDFPGIPDRSIDYCFSFGCFVHLDLPVIETYLDNMKRIMKKNGNIVLHYSDKNKVMAKENPGFANTTPEIMRDAVRARGYAIVEEDTTSLWHSALIRLQLAD